MESKQRFICLTNNDNNDKIVEALNQSTLQFSNWFDWTSSGFISLKFNNNNKKEKIYSEQKDGKSLIWLRRNFCLPYNQLSSYSLQPSILNRLRNFILNFLLLPIVIFLSVLFSFSKKYLSFFSIYFSVWFPFVKHIRKFCEEKERKISTTNNTTHT